MKYGWVVLLLVVAGISAPKAGAQASVYGEFSANYLAETGRTDILYGGTTGLVLDGPTWHHMVISADIQGRFVGKSGISMTGAAAGPRFSFPLKKHGITPYGEFLVGFARYHSTNVPNQIGSTTDGQMQVNMGVEKMVSPRWDVVADYSYSQYYAFGGSYNPKTFGVGLVFHLVKR